MNNLAGFPGILTIIFVLLKAFSYITWSWWWVLSPIWISATIVIIILIIAVIIAALTTD